MIDEKRVAMLLADVMERMSLLGDYYPHIEEAVRKSLRRVKLPESILDDALHELRVNRKGQV